jgi:hypothetical protein
LPLGELGIIRADDLYTAGSAFARSALIHGLDKLFTTAAPEIDLTGVRKSARDREDLLL